MIQSIVLVVATALATWFIMHWVRWVPRPLNREQREIGSAKTIGTTQVLNVLDNSDFIPAAAGLGVLVLGAGLSAVRHGGLPRWLGWIGVVIGILAFTPAGFFAFLASGIWIAVVSIVLTQARGQAPAVPAAPAAPA